MKIKELAVGPGDYESHLSPDGTFYPFFPTDYERIEERGWGRMSPDSPIRGICTDLVDTCFAFVFHCETNARTSLCHVVSGIDTKVFDSQIRYASEDRSPGNPVDIVAFLGHVYGRHPPPPDVDPKNIQEDLLWISDQLDLLRKDEAVRGAYAHPTPLSYGAVLVEKSTGQITIPSAPTFRVSVRLPTLLRCLPSSTKYEALTKVRVVDQFYRIQSTSFSIGSRSANVPCFEVYDGIRRVPVPPPTENTRELFRIAIMHPKFPYLDPIQQSDLDIVKRVITLENMVYVEGLAMLMQVVGALCDEPSCRRFTKQKCSRCKGAYYCSRAHQDGQWANHKGWCKAHHSTPGGSLIVGVRMGKVKKPASGL
ncbi:hypothetical protein R3P38DRAFT_1360220 [Favolaschia claudopus]|uniref:MYND-type domain-containing protein n=1 Tax=Favolaschia claudopus TaxID=2862362 RepID=A0AAW0DS66_9AGAR